MNFLISINGVFDSIYSQYSSSLPLKLFDIVLRGHIQAIIDDTQIYHRCGTLFAEEGGSTNCLVYVTSLAISTHVKRAHIKVIDYFFEISALRDCN